MNWDQIERKWDEMTRRVQPFSSLPVTGRSKLSQDEVALSAASIPAESPGLAASSIAAKPFE